MIVEGDSCFLLSAKSCTWSEKGNRCCLVVISLQVLLRVKPSLSNDLACGFTNRKHGHEINQLDNIVMTIYVLDHPFRDLKSYCKVPRVFDCVI